MPIDVMLVYPPFSVEERYARKVGKGIGGHLPPLGIAALAAFVREAGFTVDVVDSLAFEYTDDDIIKRIDACQPKVVGLSALTCNFHRAASCASRIRQSFPSLPIVLGGHHATITGPDILRSNECFDITVIGEGEHTLLELLTLGREVGYQRGTLLGSVDRLAGIKGIAFRKGGDIVVSAPRDYIADLDVLPFPARDLLPMDRYIPLPNQYLRTPVVHMTAIRGCPFSCAFCSNNAVFGRRVRFRSPKKAVDEIEHVMAKYNAREISFWDDTMTVNKEWMFAFCDEIVGRALDVTWTGYARADTVTPELLGAMKRAGCWNLFYGFEAGDQSLLNMIGKNMTLDTIRQANRWTREAGIEVRASFMLALPGETPALAKKTVDFAIELDPDYAQFSITTPYPGTALWRDASKHGQLDQTFKDYHGWSPVFVPWGYRDREEILATERMAVRRFYLRPRFVMKCLRKIRTRDDVIRYIKGLRMLLGFV